MKMPFAGIKREERQGWAKKNGIVCANDAVECENRTPALRLHPAVRAGRKRMVVNLYLYLFDKPWVSFPRGL